MLIKSALVTQASGSVGGMTASRNRGGMYLRSRAIPTNPNTGQQQAVRSLMASLMVVWQSVLTPTQRAAWELYATNTPFLNRVGAAIKLSGLNCYVRTNIPRLQATATRIDNAPTIFNLGSLTAPTIASATAATGIISLGITNSDLWATVPGGHLLVYVGRQQNPTINYFRGPYQYAGRVNGAVVPPSSPQNITSPFPFATGRRIFVRCVAAFADGRLSAEWQGGILSV